MIKRYRRARDARSKLIAFRVTEEQHVKIVAAAKKKKISMSHYIDDCIMHFIVSK